MQILYVDIYMSLTQSVATIESVLNSFDTYICPVPELHVQNSPCYAILERDVAYLRELPSSHFHILAVQIEF